MCGIALTYYKSKHRSTGAVKSMINVMAHRGYDQVTVDDYDTCTVGFRRLAITDLKADQPQGDKWKVYLNGEIYNYRELGFEGSECSVISQGLEMFGPAFVNALNGMFLIVAIHGEHVYVFRDRYGIKPAYYFETDEVIVIASEAKAIAVHPAYTFAVNESAKRQWLTFNNVFTNETLFNGILKMDKGTYWHLNSGMKVKYWQWNFKPDESMDFDYAVKRVRSLVEQAISRQIPGEVPYCVSLSGGVDSNIIAGMIDGIEGFTATFSGCDDERNLARLSGRTLHEREFWKVHELHKTVYHAEDLRVGASWANYGIYELMAVHGKKVCFDGAGADELFGGYSWRYSADDYYSIVNRTGCNDEYCEAVFKEVFPVDTLLNRYKFDADHFLEGVLLIVDKLSMAHTIEVRVPFLDNDLVDFCLTLPARFKENKKVLKAAFADVVHPDILTGKKRGFSSPDWIQGEGNQANKWATAALNEWMNIYNKQRP